MNGYPDQRYQVRGVMSNGRIVCSPELSYSSAEVCRDQWLSMRGNEKIRWLVIVPILNLGYINYTKTAYIPNPRKAKLDDPVEW